MKFYRSPTDYVEISETDDPVLGSVLGLKYGFIDDFSKFTDETIVTWSKNYLFLIYTTDSVFQEEVICKNDRSCRTLEDFMKTNTPEEQWRYYRSFLEHDSTYRFIPNGIGNEYVAMFDETGVVLIRHYNNMLVSEDKDGHIIDMTEMSRLEWEKLIHDLKNHGQLKD
jgi:hypothetical protein